MELDLYNGPAQYCLLCVLLMASSFLVIIDQNWSVCGPWEETLQSLVRHGLLMIHLIVYVFKHDRCITNDPYSLHIDLNAELITVTSNKSRITV